MEKQHATESSVRLRHVNKDTIGVEIRFKTEDGWLSVTMTEHDYIKFTQDVFTALYTLEPADIERGHKYAQFMGMRNDG